MESVEVNLDVQSASVMFDVQSRAEEPAIIDKEIGRTDHAAPHALLPVLVHGAFGIDINEVQTKRASEVSELSLIADVAPFLEERVAKSEAHGFTGLIAAAVGRRCQRKCRKCRVGEARRLETLKEIRCDEGMQCINFLTHEVAGERCSR
jgi:hypothetical protein